MKKENVSSLIVQDNEYFYGIVTERDFTRKVVAVSEKKRRKNSPKIIKDIMTPKDRLHTVCNDDAVQKAVEIVEENKKRHIPVIELGRCIAIISIRNLYVVQDTLDRLDDLHEDLEMEKLREISSLAT